MPALVTDDHDMVEQYWSRRRQSNANIDRQPSINLVDLQGTFRTAMEIMQRRLETMVAASADWKQPWQPALHIVDDENTAFAYALQGSTGINWIFISSKTVESLHWYAGNIGIKCALELSKPGPPNVALVQACETAAFDSMLGYYLEHEIAHHTDGHLALKMTVNTTPEADQALELAADTIAFEKLVSAELARMRAHLEAGLNPIGCVAASTLTFFSILPPMRATRYLTLRRNPAEHPNSAFRQTMGMSMWINAASLALDTDIIEIALPCIQVVVCAFLERGNPSDRAQAEELRAMLGGAEKFPFLRAADLRRVLYDPDVFDYGKRLALRYEQLSPALRAFRRGAQQPDVRRHWSGPHA